MPELSAKLRRSLILHEQYRRYPYYDSVGKITIGIGFNLSDRGIDDEWINNRYEKDVNFFYNKLSNDFHWFKNLNIDRQVVLIDMAFMGYRHFLQFKKMIEALEKEDFQTASQEMLDSKWAKQTKNRAVQLAEAMRTGVYDI